MKGLCKNCGRPVTTFHGFLVHVNTQIQPCATNMFGGKYAELDTIDEALSEKED